MPTQDNSPSKGYVRWFDMRIIYKGQGFKIKDGSTRQRYVFWDITNPTILKTSDVIPHENNIILFINNSGVLTTYPLQEGVYLNDVNSSSGANLLLMEHISNKSFHVTEDIVRLIDTLGSKLENAILRIEQLENK